MKPRKSQRQLAAERTIESNRKALDREQAAANFLALVEAKKKRSRAGPTWPVDSEHAGRLASAGTGHDALQGHEAAAGKNTATQTKPPKRGQR